MPSSACLEGPTASPVYLTPVEVADLLRLSVKRVYAIAADDPSMPVLRLAGRGSALRFPREPLERWLAERTQGRLPIRSRVRALANTTPQKGAGGA